MALLTCENLSIGYDKNVMVSHLQFTVNEGDYLCIVGENGSGKSTLMKTILGLIPPVSGRILTGDGLEPSEIGYLPQQTAVQKDFPASVWEIVLSGAENGQSLHAFYTKKEKERARQSMEKLKIAPLKRHCYRELSGGQQQRVLLARALCAAHSLLLLDEPVTGLDPDATADFYQIVETLNREEQMTIIMISHDIHAALRYSSHILHIGPTIFYGTTSEYQNSALGQHFTQREDRSYESDE